MRVIVSSLAVASLLLLSAGCDLERSPGPHQSEHGSVLFWSIVDDELTWGELCSDADQVRDALDFPQLQEDSFLMYRLSDDGESATLQDCTSTDASTCSDSAAGVVFEVSGNTLTADRGTRLSNIENAACELKQHEIWTLTDEGETLDFLRELHLDLVGAECPDFESWLKGESPNNQGLVGCVVSLQASAVFHSSSR